MNRPHCLNVGFCFECWTFGATLKFLQNVNKIKLWAFSFKNSLLFRNDWKGSLANGNAITQDGNHFSCDAIAKLLGSLKITVFRIVMKVPDILHITSLFRNISIPNPTPLNLTLFDEYYSSHECALWVCIHRNLISLVAASIKTGTAVKCFPFKNKSETLFVTLI